MEIIFEILCGILYLIGLPFGLDYKETSIIVCIYLWPTICTLSTIPILWISIKRRIMISIILSILYTFVYVCLSIDAINRYPLSNPQSFMNCMIDLESLANYLKITYVEINLFIYVVLFILIIFINFIIFKLIKKL